MPILDWIKKNKLSTFLLVILLIILFKSFFGSRTYVSNSLSRSSPGTMALDSVSTFGEAGMTAPQSKSVSSILPPNEVAPQPQITSRMVIQNSDLSLLVTNVTDVRDKIVDFAQQLGGYMVSSNISNPQDAPTANVIIRVPSTKLKETLTFLHAQAIKVVSENLSGTDITDQFVDIEKRIAILTDAKNKFQGILAQAKEINDITNLTSQILNYQNQIDSYRGQQEAMAKEAETVRITIYLSTDEIALPYAPSDTFRPNVIFKLAVRSLVGDLRSLAGNLIWVGVYSVIWLPIILIIWLVWRNVKAKR